MKSRTPMIGRSRAVSLCNHGYFLHDCAICEKRPGECDFGSCQRRATTLVVAGLQKRPMCAGHAELSRTLGIAH